MEWSERIQEELQAFPILEYACLKTSQVSFLQRVRTVCETECPRYNTSWSCPPAVGSVQECEKRCNCYKSCFLFSTIAEVNDITNLEETLATRMAHEQITHQVSQLFRREWGEVITLSTESCDLCTRCAYPDRPCVHPDKMFPCVESYGILVTDLAEQAGMSFENGANVVTWFSVIFFDRKENAAGEEDDVIKGTAAAI